MQNVQIKNKTPFKVWHVIILSAIAAAVIFALHFVMLKIDNVWPFSSRIPSQYDLLAQVAPFAEHIFDVLSGDGSLFYSYRIAGGMDTFGTLVYCMISPFSILFWVLGEGNAWQAAAIMMPAKISCMAISAIVMIKLCFPYMKKPVAFAVAVVYSFCGYVFVSNTYPNWMDFLIYLPYALPAFRSLVTKGKIWPLSLVIALCIYTCFSICCFSMFVSYPALVVYAFMVEEKGKGKRKRYLTKLSLCYICGVIAALPILIPALMVYVSSGRNTGIFDSLWNDITSLSYSRKLSYILSDAIFLVFIIIYFIKTHFCTKESRFALVSGIFIMMPVLVDECCALMNMGSYMSYALRFGFLNALYELIIACRVLESFSFKEKKLLPDGLTCLPESVPAQLPPQYTPVKTNKRKKIIAERQSKTEVKKGNALAYAKVYNRTPVKSDDTASLILTVFLPFVATALLLLLAYLGVLAIYNMSDTYSSSASSFAHSTGAVELTLWILFYVGIAAIAAAILYFCGLASPKIIFVAMAVLLAAQVGLYDNYLVSGNIYNHIRYDQFSELYSEVLETEELEPYEYRIKDYGNYISDNQGLYTNSASYSVFSSMTDSDNFAFNTVFGMGGNSVNTIKSTGGNLLGNCLIGNKYYFYNSEGSEDSRPTLSYDFLEEVGRNTYFIMYKNNLVFPSAFTVSSGDMGVVTDYNSYFDNMQNLYAFLGGEGSVFTEYTLTEDDVVETQVDDGNGGTVTVFMIKFHRPDAGDYTVYPYFPEGSDVKWYSGTYAVATMHDMSEIKTFTYSNALPNTYYYIYFVGENLTQEYIINHCSYRAITTQTVEELSQSLWRRQVKYTMSSTLLTTTITANVTAQTEGQYLFVNYVALDGHTAYVNGKKVDMVSNGLNMMVVPLEEGENEVVIKYNSPYVTYGAVGLCVAVVALVLIAVFLCGKKGEKNIEKVKTAGAVASVVLAALVVAFFMIFPTVVFAIKIVKLLL